jgi:MoxR-like ATPase
VTEDWLLRPDAPADSLDQAWRRLPTPSIDSWTDPKDYIADPPLLAAINTALLLGQPLLVTGDPGCGKTELANFVAWRLGLGREIGRKEDGQPAYEFALRFDMKSDTRARDLFYSIDLIERFHAAHVAAAREDLNPLLFIRFNALGRALLYARPEDRLSTRLHDWQAHPGSPRRSVVLIDEMDKAPGDVPNDLLVELERMRVFIPEMNFDLVAPLVMRPIVIITSNRDRKFSDAFLRRCIYYHISFPDRDRLQTIVNRRLQRVENSGSLVIEAVDEFLRIRGLPLFKQPGTAELLAFVEALVGFGYDLGRGLRGTDTWHQIAITSLLKTHEDQQRAAAAWAAT